MNIKFTVPGTPVGKGRPRVTAHGTFTPQKTKDYEKLVQLAYRESLCVPFTDPAKALFCAVNAYFQVPPSYSKKKHRELPGTPFLHKPDTDNVEKAILDALNGVAYPDDSQIAAAACFKHYGKSGGSVVFLTDDVREFAAAVVEASNGA